MGYLQYGTSGTQIRFDDRTLAHLQIVITAKLRRDESFFFSWLDDPALGDGRSSIWLSTSIPLLFHFSATAGQDVNRDWLDLLSATANSAQGLFLADEPGRVTPRPQATGTPTSKAKTHDSTHLAVPSGRPRPS